MTKKTSSGSVRTLAEAERDHILEELNETRWVLDGTEGAANTHYSGLPDENTRNWRDKSVKWPRKRSVPPPKLAALPME